LIGTGIARGPNRLRWNTAGVALSTAYLGWSMLAQAWVTDIAERNLAAQGIAAERMLVTPTPFNTLLWRVLVMDADGSSYHEGFYALADRGRPIRFRRFSTDAALHRELADEWPVARMTWFSHGFYRMREDAGRALIADLRMGQQDGYVFEFVVARRGSGWRAAPIESVGERGDARAGLAWIWRRLQGEELPPP
jgi:inner membrane protein